MMGRIFGWFQIGTETKIHYLAYMVQPWFLYARIAHVLAFRCKVRLWKQMLLILLLAFAEPCLFTKFWRLYYFWEKKKLKRIWTRRSNVYLPFYYNFSISHNYHKKSVKHCFFTYFPLSWSELWHWHWGWGWCWWWWWWGAFRTHKHKQTQTKHFVRKLFTLLGHFSKNLKQHL